MGYAKRKQGPASASGVSRIDRGPPLDDRLAETILEAVYDDDDGDPVAGIRNAIIAGIALWLIVAAVAFVLI